MYFIHKGRIDTSKVITIKALHDAGVFSTAKYGVKLIGGVKYYNTQIHWTYLFWQGLDTIDRPLNLEISDASESVIKAIK